MVEFQPELYDPGGVSPGDLAEVGLAEDGTGRVSEIDLIPGVEELGAELEAYALGRMDVLENRHIPVMERRPEIVGQKAANVTEGVRSGVGEGSGVEPA